MTVAPLTIYDQGPNGEITEANRRFWENRFRGFGLFIMPFTNVHPSGIGFESPQAFDEDDLPTLREYVAIVQIAHAGKHAQAIMSKGFDVVDSSDDVSYNVRSLTSGEVRYVEEREMKRFKGFVHRTKYLERTVELANQQDGIIHVSFETIIHVEQSMD